MADVDEKAVNCNRSDWGIGWLSVSITSSKGP